MTPKVQLVLACLLISVGSELFQHGNKMTLKGLAKRIFYVTVSSYIGFELLTQN